MLENIDTGEQSSSMTDAGSGSSVISDYHIYDSSNKDVTLFFTNITTSENEWLIEPAPLTITTGSASKDYDGTALTNSKASIDGLVGGDEGKVTVTATGTITYVGSTPNTYTIDWGGAKSGNYTITEEKLGTLEISLPTEESIEELEDDATWGMRIYKTVTSTPANGTGYTLGETITYDITAENVGNVSDRFTVTDELTGNEWTTEILAPGKSQTFHCSYVVTEADISAGNVMGLRTM